MWSIYSKPVYVLIGLATFILPSSLESSTVAMNFHKLVSLFGVAFIVNALLYVVLFIMKTETDKT